MKTVSVATFVLAACAAIGSSATPTHHRRLQNMPPANGQGQFRPGPGGLPPQFGGGMPMQGNGFPANGQMAGPQNFQNVGTGGMPMMGAANTQNFQNIGAGGVPMMGAANTQNIGVGEADMTAAGSAAGANAATPAPADPAAATPSMGAAPTDLAPGQPTIMVILPDSIAAHSGWSSYSGDVGETKSKTPATEKPADSDKRAETSGSQKTMTMSTILTTAASVAVLGLLVTA